MRINFVGEEPTRAHATDAGGDLRCPKRVVLTPGKTTVVGTGTFLETPVGFVGFVTGRSGLASRGIDVPLGKIDSDYRGEIMLIFNNHSEKAQILEAGDRVAQIVFVPIAYPQFERVAKLDRTERGDGGLGSTGTA